MTFTQDELVEILYCIEEMTSAYDDEDEGYKHYLSAFEKLEKEYK